MAQHVVALSAATTSTARRLKCWALRAVGAAPARVARRPCFSGLVLNVSA